MAESLQSRYQSLMAMSHRANKEREIAWLLEEITGTKRAHFSGTVLEDLSAECQRSLLRASKSYIAGKPLAYILGSQPFCHLSILVEEGVLIPRPDTEILVKLAIDYQNANPRPLRVLDLGCGSGCVMCVLGDLLQNAEMIGIDRDIQACALTQANIDQLGLTNCRVVQGDWRESLALGLFDIVVANPPYIAKGDPMVAKDVAAFEPDSALYAEDEGFSDITHIIELSKSLLRPGGTLILEHGVMQQSQVESYFQVAGYQKVSVHQMFGQPRAVQGFWG